MAGARGQEHWQHTSVVLAMLANTHRDPKRTRAFKPSDFDPYSKKREKIRVTDMSALKAAFVRQKSGGGGG